MMFHQEMISRATALWILLGCLLAWLALYLVDKRLFKEGPEPEPVDTMVGVPYLEDTKAPASWQHNESEEPQEDRWEHNDSDEPQYDG